jgi:hypothetical protein
MIRTLLTVFLISAASSSSAALIEFGDGPDNSGSQTYVFGGAPGFLTIQSSSGSLTQSSSGLGAGFGSSAESGRLGGSEFITFFFNESVRLFSISIAAFGGSESDPTSNQPEPFSVSLGPTPGAMLLSEVAEGMGFGSTVTSFGLGGVSTTSFTLWGAATGPGNQGIRISALEAEIPLPASAFFLIAGLGGLALRKRANKN